MTQDDVKGILEPYHDMIRQVIDESWDEWRDVHQLRLDAGYPSLLYRRTVSNYVFDAIARRAIPAFAAMPLVNVKIESQTFKLQFRGLCARFKKGGIDNLGCNWPTQAVMAFIDADGMLPDMPPETAKVEFIWQPNEIWTQIDRVLVVARDGDDLIWEYPIDRRSAAGKLFVVPTRTPPPDPDGQDLVKPKAIPDEKPDKV